MTRDARRNGRCDSIIIFEIRTIFCTEIQVKSFNKLCGSDRMAAILEVIVIKNFLL